MKLFKEFFKNRKLGFYLAFAAGCLAVVFAIVYLICYLSIAKDNVMDRVYSIITLLLVLFGGLVILVGELFKIDFVIMAGPILIAVGLANHSVEAAYPIADILTGVAFFGGNQQFAILFIILFGVAFLVGAISIFFEHNSQKQI